jgi:RimJ/RimL family protein N-acetyltransferase
MMIAPEITTERLILRTVRHDDFESYAAMWRDPRVTEFVGGKPRPRDATWRRFCQCAGLWPLLGYGYWLITLRGSGEMIGVGGLAQFERGIDQLQGFPEAGWAFGADQWGQGYASESLAAITGWSDAALKREMRCIIDPENTPSIRVAVKNGFTQIDEVQNELGISLVFSRGHALGGVGVPQRSD